ncbi:hypothetical protein MRX96_040513 [Rhipicephalus microplus]
MQEFHLFYGVFFHERAGQLQRAKELAAVNGHRWLAAALEGCRPWMTQATPVPLAPTSSNPPKAPSTGTYGSAPAGERRRIRDVRVTSALCMVL